MKILHNWSKNLFFKSSISSRTNVQIGEKIDSLLIWKAQMTMNMKLLLLSLNVHRKLSYY